MGRIENGMIVNHSGIARVRLNEQELHAILQAMDCYLAKHRSHSESPYYHGLGRLRRKLERNRKRLNPFKGFTLSDKHVLFVKPKEGYY